MADNNNLTEEFIATVKSATSDNVVAINAFLAGMNLQQEIDKAKNEPKETV